MFAVEKFNDIIIYILYRYTFAHIRISHATMLSPLQSMNRFIRKRLESAPLLTIILYYYSVNCTNSYRGLTFLIIYMRVRFVVLMYAVIFSPYRNALSVQYIYLYIYRGCSFWPVQTKYNQEQQSMSLSWSWIPDCGYVM